MYCFVWPISVCSILDPLSVFFFLFMYSMRVVTSEK